MHQRGFAGTTVRDIGTAVGLLSGSLYHHFREKEDILYEIQLMLNQRIASIPPVVESSGLGPLDKVGFLVALHLAMVEDNLSLCHVAYTEFRHLKPAHVSSILGPQRAYNEFLVGLIVEAQKAGEARPDLDARTSAGAIFGLLNSVIWWRQPRGRPTREELTSTYRQLLLSGLSTRSIT
jgi:AcrR family transcriptional regulator